MGAIGRYGSAVGKGQCPVFFYILLLVLETTVLVLVRGSYTVLMI